MELKNRMNPINAAFFLGEKCTDIVKGYRISINSFPSSSDSEFWFLLKVTNYDLFEHIINRECWDYGLLSIEYNRILKNVKDVIRSMPERENLPLFAKKSVDSILSLIPIGLSI